MQIVFFILFFSFPECRHSDRLWGIKENRLRPEEQSRSSHKNGAADGVLSGASAPAQSGDEYRDDGCVLRKNGKNGRRGGVRSGQAELVRGRGIPGAAATGGGAAGPLIPIHHDPACPP
jgi:hypothetical protein